MDECDVELADFWLECQRQAALDQAREDLKQLGLNLCEDCGNEIGKTRKRALPSATRCIGCQQRHEGDFGQRPRFGAADA